MKKQGRFRHCLKYAVCFALLFTLLCSPGIGAAQENNLVRILLTAFQPCVQLKVYIYGNYVLNQGLSFQRGSELTIFVTGKQLQVHFEGMIYLAGEKVSLIRHRSEDGLENGLRIQEELNLYPGDLHISVSNGGLVPVLALPVEEYLHGVVPYEMSDEFGLEALKAQSVAARTYTLANLSPGQPFDLEDNTNDQVFRGINENNPNSDMAINQTKNLVLTFEGTYARTFYTASNGGFTESAYNSWGRENIPYLKVKEDPYDFENPLSIVRSATIPKEVPDPAGPQWSDLASELHARGSLLLQKGMKSNEPLQFKISRIEGIAPHTTKDGSVAGVMTRLRFDVLALVDTPVEDMEDTEVSVTSDGSILQEDSGRAGNRTIITMPETISIDLPVFPDIERMLNLSINRNENELVTVRETENEFIIQFRRYGHGVGLSQRGAEQMAGAHGWDYRQILSYYFEGTEITELHPQASLLPELSLNFLTTPGPVPTATPRPTLMPQTSAARGNEYVVYVTGISTVSSLNLRAQPDLLGEILTRLYYGQELLVLRELTDGWLEVKTDVLTGYVRSEFVSRTRDGQPD